MMTCGNTVHTAKEESKNAGGNAVLNKQTTEALLERSVQYLASVCDGAQERDGSGFNKPDSYMGKFLAHIPANKWTFGQKVQAYEMLGKYSKQLRYADIEYKDIPSPVDDGSSKHELNGSIETEGRNFIFYFNYDDEIINEIRSMGGRYFDDSWHLPITHSNAEWVGKFANNYDFHVAGTSKDYIENPSKITELGSPDDGERVIQVNGNEFEISFPYNQAIIFEIKSTPSRHYDPATKHWFVAVSEKSIEWVTDFAGRHDFVISGGLPTAPAQENQNESEKLPAKHIRIEDGKLLVAFPYDEQLVSVLRGTGRSFGRALRAWIVSPSKENALFVQAIAEKYDFHLTDEAKEWAEHILEEKEKNVEANDSSAVLDLQVQGLKKELRDFQKVAVDYASRNKRVLIADDMGLGKTIEALATVQNLNAYPAVIVCPASVKYNWRKESDGWLENKKVAIVEGKSGEIDPDADIIILNYDILESHEDDIKGLKPKSFIFDESQLLKNYKAKRTISAQRLSKFAPVRLLLSGTPMLNRPKELISQLSIMDRLNDFGGFWNFANRYCAARQTNFGTDMDGAANLDELNDRLRANCYIRRMKEDVLAELPEKQRMFLDFRIDNRREYDRAENDFRSWVARYASDNKAFRASIKDLPESEQTRKIAIRSASAVNKALRAEALVKIGRLRQLASQGKIKAVKEWTQNFVDSDRKLVVFATYEETIDALRSQFPDAPYITGKVTGEKRQQMVERFQNDPNTKIIIMNTKAGGVGITLTAASDVAFVETSWTMADHEQAEDRVHRFGQKNAVNAYYLVDDTTIDGVMMRLLESKQSVVDMATNGTNASMDSEDSLVDELIQALI